MAAAEVGREDRRRRRQDTTEQGKMEKSFLNFRCGVVYSSWYGLSFLAAPVAYHEANQNENRGYSSSVVRSGQHILFEPVTCIERH